jgi:hypothetical protein
LAISTTQHIVTSYLPAKNLLSRLVVDFDVAGLSTRHQD